MRNIEQWQKSPVEVFWGEIAPYDHVVQVYENDDVFLDTLVGFISEGIKVGDCVVIIASSDHLESLELRMSKLQLMVPGLREDGCYLPINAEEMLSKFMVNGWPDEKLFTEAIDNLIQRARSKGKKVRAFGEMVAILWAQGHNGATVQLEHLWNKYCKDNKFSLYCAYPKAGFTKDINESIELICGCHAKVLRGDHAQPHVVSYSNFPLEETK